MVESFLIDVSRQRLLHSVQRPEGPQIAPLTPESGAPYFEGVVCSLVAKGVKEEERAIGRGNLERGFKNKVAWIVSGSSLALDNYGDLEDLFFDEDRLMVLSEDKVRVAKELYYSIMDGVVLGLLFDDVEDDLKEAIKKKDAKGVEAVLGVGILKGIGKVVVETSITDNKLERALHVLQGKVRLDGTFAEGDVKRVLDKIDDWLLDGAIVQDEADMVVAYLTAFITDRKGEIKQERVNIKVTEEGDLQNQYLVRQVELGKKIEAVTYHEWLDSLMSKPSPVSRQTSLWELEPPDWLKNGDPDEKLSEWRDILSLVDGMSIVVAQRRRDDTFMISIDKGGVKDKIMSYFNLPEKYLKWLYEHQSLGFRPALETMMKELFTRNKDGVFEFKDPDGDKNVKDFLEDSGEYKKKLAQQLLGRSKVKSLDQGYIAVSMAADFLELGGQLEAADTNRRIGHVSDALRVVMRPVTKFSSKAEGGELWGGGWSNYLMELYGKDNVMTVANRMGIMPHVLCGSIVNLMVDVQGKKEKVALGDALIEGWDVRFGKAEGDVYFTTKKKILAACDIWTYISGDKPLQFSKVEEFDNVLMTWKKGLHNAVIELSDGGKKHSLRGNITSGVVAAAIGGSTGLWPFEGPYLWISDRAADYRKMVAQIVRQVTVDGNQITRLEKFFGIGGIAFADDEVFETRVARYKYSISGYPKIVKKIFGYKKPGKNFENVKAI